MAVSAESSPPPVASEGASSRLSLWLVLAGMLAVFGPTLVWLWGRWTMSVWHNAHGLLILPVVAYFVREELKTRRHLPQSSSALGFLFLVPALALARARRRDAHRAAERRRAGDGDARPVAAASSAWSARRAILVPLAFLALALPIPLSFTENIHLALRHVATAATAAIVPVLGVPVFVEGTTLHTAQGALQVADACSGFSTLYAAVAVAMLTAYQSASPARRVLVLLGAAPIAIASNILRVVTARDAGGSGRAATSSTPSCTRCRAS